MLCLSVSRHRVHILVNHSVIFKHNFDSLMNTFSEPCLQSLDNNPGGTVHVHTVCSLPTHESHEISETQPLPCSHEPRPFALDFIAQLWRKINTVFWEIRFKASLLHAHEWLQFMMLLLGKWGGREGGGAERGDRRRVGGGRVIVRNTQITQETSQVHTYSLWSWLQFV